MKVFLHLEFGIKPDVFNLECAHYILGAKTWYNINVQYFIKIIFNFYYLINIPWKVAKGARHEQTILLWMKYLIFTLLAKNCPFCHQHSTKYQQSYSLPLPSGHVLSLSRPILHTEPKSNFPIRSIQKKATVNLSLFNKYFEITSRYLFGNCTLFSGKVLICRKWERIFTRARVWLLHWNWFTETFYSCVEFNPRVFTHHQVKFLPQVKGKVLPKSF